jgi:hypothetical protein
MAFDPATAVPESPATFNPATAKSAEEGWNPFTQPDFARRMTQLSENMPTTHWGLIKRNFSMLSEFAQKPIAELPDLPAMPDVPGMLQYNPALWGGVYRGAIKPLIEGVESPLGIATLGIFGEMRAAAKLGSPGAIRAYKSMVGGFWALMTGQTVMQTPDVIKTIKNPAATLEDKVSSVAGAASSASMAVVGALGLVEQFHPDTLPAIEGKNIAEVPPILRSHAEAALTPQAKAALELAADTIERATTATEEPKPMPAGAVYLGKKPLVMEGEPPVDQWQIDQTPDSPRGRTVDRATLEKEGYVVPDEPGAPGTVPPMPGEPVTWGPIPGQAKEHVFGQEVPLTFDPQKAVPEIAELRRKATVFAAKMADSESALDATAIKSNLLDMAKGLPPAERGRFSQAIANAMERPVIGKPREGMYRNAMTVMFRMLNRGDEIQRNGIIADIQGTMQKALDSPSVDVAYKRKIEQVLQRVAFKGITDVTRSSLEGTREYIASKGDAHGVPDDVVHKLEQLTKTPARELPLNVLESLREQVDSLVRLGKTTVRSRQALYDLEQGRLADEIKAGNASALDERTVTRTPGEQVSLPVRVSRAVEQKVVKGLDYAQKIERSVLVRDVMLDILDGDANYTGPLNKIFGGRIDADYNAEMNLRRSLHEPLEKVLERQKFSDVELERISIYAIAREKNGVQRLLDSGVSPQTIASVNETITQKELKFYGTARQLFDETVYPALKKFMRDNYNVEVAKVDNYWPFQRDYTLVEPNLKTPELKAAKGDEIGFDEMATWRSLEQDFIPRSTTKTEQGMTIARLPEAHGAVRLNAVDVIDRHLRQVAHLLSYQRDMKMLGQIAREDWFGERYGKLGQKYVLDLLDTVSRDSAPAAATRTAWIDWLTKNTSVGIIGLRLLSQMKHAPNVAFSFLKNVRPDYMIRGYAEALSSEGRAFVRNNFAEINQRFGGEPAIADVANGNLWRKVQGSSFFLERALDSLDARAAVLGRYFQELENRGIDSKNYSGLPVDKEAQRMAVLISRQAVTSPLRKDIPQAISRGALTGKQMSWARALFQFQNTMLRQYGFVRHDIWDLGLKKLNPSQFATATLAFLSMLAGETLIVETNRKLIGAASTNKEEESFAKGMATEALRRVPFAGNLVTAATYGDTGMPVVDTMVGGIRAGGKLVTQKGQFGQKLSQREAAKAKVDVAAFAGEVTGIPGASTAAQIYKNKIMPKRNAFTLRAQ